MNSKRQPPAINITQEEGGEPFPAEVIAQSIADIAEGMRKLNSTRLTREAIVTLLHASSGVNKSTIKIVLNNLESLETTWLKKKS